MILCYSVSTGLCGLSRGPWDYVVYCFITGVGAGGIFPIACTLVAESLPDGTRPQALGMVQALSALGNVGAGFISLGMVLLFAHGVIGTYWRWMFSVGIVPSLLAFIVMRKLREPEVWRQAVTQGKTRKAGLRELFAEPRWRRNAIVGLLLATSGVVGLWGIGVFSNDLTQRFIGAEIDQKQRDLGEAQKDLQFVGLAIASPGDLGLAERSGIQPRQLLGINNEDHEAQRLYAAALKLAEERRTVSLQSVDEAAGPSVSGQPRRLADLLPASGPPSSVGEHIDRILARQKARSITVLQWAAVTLIMFNVGAFFGMYAFARVTHKIGRRPTFAIFFLIAMAATALAFRYMSRMPQDLWMVALMGGAQLSIFGGYAIYFPELFPTRLRSTGTSFCYNVGRYVSAVGPFTKGLLIAYVFASPGHPAQAERSAGVAMCVCYVVGLVALLFAPETKGQPLPE